MKILIADDDPVNRRRVELLLKQWQHEVAAVQDGIEALNCVRQANPPELAILDWLMPGLDGIKLCQVFREIPALKRMYIILLTAMDKKEEIALGLDSGAHDYITKPFDTQELRARVQVGVRMIELQNELTQRLDECEKNRSEISELRGILPICSYCKKIRADTHFWEQVESYISKNSAATFSHGICPECYEKFIRPELEEMKRELPPGKPGI